MMVGEINVIKLKVNMKKFSRNIRTFSSRVLMY